LIANARTRALGVAFLAALLSSCGSNAQTTTPEDPVPTTLAITPSIVAFSFLTESRALLADIRDQNGGPFAATVTWSTSDAAVVSIDAAGVASAIGNGSATITATAAGLTSTLTIQVQQQPRVILAQQGDDQEAIAGRPLADTIIVRLTDLGGSSVEGVTVVFAPDSTAGTVTVDTVVTGPDGLAATVWTLGSAFGPQALVVTAGDLETTLESFSRSETPIADLIFESSVSLSRADPTTRDSLIVTATVRNQGDLDTGGPFCVEARVGGVEVAFVDDVPGLDPDEEVQVQLQLPPLAAGAQTLELVLDPAGLLPELIETNNQSSRSLNVLQQSPISLGVPVTGLSASVGQELLFVLEVPPGAGDALNITITDPSPGQIDDLDLFVAQGSRPAFREDYLDCVSANPSTTEACQIVFPEGTYHILLHAWEDVSGEFPTTGFSNVTLEATIGGAIEPYDLDYTLIASFTSEQEAAIDQAVSYWQDIIRGGLTAVEGTQGLENPCGLGQPALSSVDDMQLYVGLLPDTLQGLGGTLAAAGPCRLRPITYLPYLGVARFDPVDLELMSSEEVYRVMLHEIGHTLGIGSTWSLQGLLQDPSLDGSGNAIPGVQDTHFSGQRAREAFAAIAAGYSGSTVPVENQQPKGSGDSHWRESVFGTELMTFSLNASASLNPLSAVSIRSLEDLGYVVDVSQAEAFILPASSPSLVVAQTQVTIDLRYDVTPIPESAFGPKHRLRRVRR